MTSRELEKVLDWARVGEGYSLTRIYLRIRKLHGISRLDPNYRRYRPYLLSKELSGTWLWGKQVLADRETAQQFLSTLSQELGFQLRMAPTPDSLPRHSQRELGIIFLELHQQRYGTKNWSPETIPEILILMNKHLEKSWLPGDLETFSENSSQGKYSLTQIGKADYNEIVKFPPYAWIKEVIRFLYGESKFSDDRC
jgi:hypothetical protein